MEDWAAPGWDDTQLSKSGLPLELHRAQLTDCRVSAFRVVEALDIVKHVCLCVIARPVRNMASFFRNMREPLQLRSVRLAGPDLVVAEYHYIYASGKVCNARAEVTTAYVFGNTFIQGIKASC